MIKKAVITVASALILATSGLSHAAGQFEFDFDASSPNDQLAWAPQETTTQVTLASQPTKAIDIAQTLTKKNHAHWDPLGVVITSKPLKASNKKITKSTHNALIKRVSAHKVSSEKAARIDIESTRNIWNITH